MDQATRNKLRSVVTQCRRLLEEAVAQVLQGQFGVYAAAKSDEVQVEPASKMTHLSPEDRDYRKDILDHFEHVKALGYKPTDSLAQLVREVAFTHLNRLCAYKMMEARGLIRESVSKGLKSQGFLFYLADHDVDQKRHAAGQQDVAYRHFLNWLGGTRSDEIGVLFSPTDPANRLYPPQRVLDEVLGLLNSEELAGIWTQDEAIGWVYQYFTPKELRDQARKESAAPRNSYELAFRNQFFTPRYVVEFLTDNTLGRIWYEMRQAKTGLADRCRYLVRQPDEVFLARATSAEQEHSQESVVEAARLLREGDEDTFPEFGTSEDSVQRMIDMAHTVSAYDRHGDEAFQIWNWEDGPKHAERAGELPTQYILEWLFMTCRADRHGGTGEVYAEPWFLTLANEVRRRALAARNPDLKAEERLRLPVFVPYRAKKDPRELKILDPACGSGHFLLYCFDLLLVIYEEAYADPELGPDLQRDYPTLADLRKAVPGLILKHNLHGIDIDLRATQIAALALWLRCQRAYQDMGMKKDRPRITKSNIVCAESMPGEQRMLKEFVGQLEPKLLGQLVEVVFEKMKLAGEAGSLLKIEEEVREAVAEAKKQWVRETTQATDRKGRQLLFTQAVMDRLSGKPEQPSLFDLSDITEGQFFEQAEAKVVESLRQYAEQAQNGQLHHRRLFTEDAVRGFAFVEMCHKHFDVVLMNPPFGEPSKPSKNWLETTYPRTKNDLYAACVERGLSLLCNNGMLGAITSRTGFFLSSFQKWREEILLKEVTPTAIADLGYGVLDAALVETAAYCLRGSQDWSNTLFFRLLASEEKGTDLASAIRQTQGEFSSPLCFLVSPRSLTLVPGAPFAYWIDGKVRSLFSRLPSFESQTRQARRGASTGDDSRRVRCWWEVRPEQIGRIRRWVPFAKGGAYSPYYADVYLLVGWDEKRRTFEGFYGRVGRMIERPEALDFFFRAGLTWPRRSTSGFGIRVLPAGCVIADKGPAVFVTDGSELATLAVLFSQSYQRLIEISLAAGEETQSGTAGRSYEVGVIQRLPWPEFTSAELSRLAEQVRPLVASVRNADLVDETTKSFIGPVALRARTLHEAALDWQRDRESSCVDGLKRAAAIETIVDEKLFDGQPNPLPQSTGDARRLCALPEGIADKQFDETYSRSIYETIREELDEEGGNRQIAVKSYYFSRHLEVLAQTLELHPGSIAQAAADRHLLPEGLLGWVAEGFLSYCVGCVLGRWDVRLATGVKQPPVLADPFDPVPACSPGMLQGDDGLPLTQAPTGYPFRIDGDGIVADDPDNPDDLLRRVREVLELIWKERAEAIEREACEILAVKELRDYFRKPGKGGFWDDHISRYSKSRRKAPIYWLFQSSKKNYALWLYYHRLDKEILFRALQQYVEPKIRLEDSRLETLRTQKAAAGDSGKAAKKLGKDMERQEDLLSELRDFEDKLRRVANLHLEPDLNDGVVLNIAPLHELVPWKEAKAYWQDLLKGEYEWSSIAKQLREKGLVK